MMDFNKAAEISGSRFVMLKDKLALLERALSNFMLNIHTQEHGYIEVNPPTLVKDYALYGTGQLPKFSEDLFQTSSGHWLIPTSEVPLTNIVCNEIIDKENLPLRYTSLIGSIIGVQIGQKLGESIDSSGLRALLAILENYQNEDGSINVPKVLQPYMNGLNKININE